MNGMESSRSKSERSLHALMRWDKHADILSHAMCARNECDDPRLRRLTTTRTFTCSPSVTSLSSFMCFVLILVFTLSLVSDVSPFSFTTETQFQEQSSFLLDVVVRLCPVKVNSDCSPNSCIFHIVKTGPLRCCPYTPRRSQ